MRTTWTLVACLVSLAGCAAPASREGVTRESELAARSLAVAFETADTALIADLFWPQATYDDFPNQATYQGLDEIIGYVTAAHQWGDDIYMNVGSVHASDAGAVSEWVFSAVQNRPMGETVPTGTGREIVMNGVTILEMEGGRIIRAADYADTTPLWLQLGARIELPGGGVIELDGAGG